MKLLISSEINLLTLSFHNNGPLQIVKTHKPKNLKSFAIISISNFCGFNLWGKKILSFILLSHYEKTPIQIYRQFHLQKLKIFRYKNSDIFHISAQNIDCGYSLEPPRRGGSNEYPQSMFLSRNKKNNLYPCKPQFYYIKVGFKGFKII